MWSSTHRRQLPDVAALIVDASTGELEEQPQALWSSASLGKRSRSRCTEKTVHPARRPLRRAYPITWRFRMNGSVMRRRSFAGASSSVRRPRRPGVNSGRHGPAFSRRASGRSAVRTRVLTVFGVPAGDATSRRARVTLRSLRPIYLGSERAQLRSRGDPQLLRRRNALRSRGVGVHDVDWRHRRLTDPKKYRPHSRSARSSREHVLLEP